MTNIRALIFFSANTGICDGHHRYFSSDAAALAFFRGKQVYSTEEEMVIRRDISLNGRNVNCCNLKGTLELFEKCEYVSYKNDPSSSRWFHNRILYTEYVAQNVTRIHFVCDYYATYIGSCVAHLGHAFYLRGHVTKGEDKINRFLLSEPVSPALTYNVDDSAVAFLQPINEQMKLEKYCVYAAADDKENTNTDQVGIHKQGGVDVYGVIKGTTKEEVEKFIKSQTNQVSTFQSMTKPMLSTVQAIKKLPEKLVSATDPIEQEFLFVPLLPSYKHAKMYSPQFFYWRIFALSSGSNLTFNTTNAATIPSNPPVLEFSFKFAMTGGLNATAIMFFDRLGSDDNPGGDIVIPSTVSMQSQYIQQLPFPNVWIDTYQTPSYSTYGMIQKLALEPIGKGISTAFGGALAGATAGGIGAGVGAGIGGGYGFGSTLVHNIADVAGQNPQVYQTVSTATTDLAMAANLYRFEIIRYYPNAGGKKTLESYFDTYGYVLNENRKINLTARNNFCYIHTRNANIRGPVPAIALKAINDMFNSGVTIWQVEIGSTGDCG